MKLVNIAAEACLALVATAALGRAARVADPAAEALADSAADPTALQVVSDRPYAIIAVRNVFALLPPPVYPIAIPKDLPPKITANGITLILGATNVLFNVDMPATGGQSGGPKSYMLSEGQREDDIEVVKIDVDAAVVTFNNHGVRQDIPLVAGGH